MSANDDLLARSLRHVWHPCTQMKQHQTWPLVPIERGEGVWLYDVDGHRYLDAVSSWWVNLFGHCNPRINAPVAAQLNTLEHVMLAGFTHRPVVELSERLGELAPRAADGTRLGHASYGSDGASAVEIALKMSFHYWRNTGRPGKQRFAALADSYHGETLGALSVTGLAFFRDAYDALLRVPLIVPVPMPERPRASTTSPAPDAPCCAECAVPALVALEAEFARSHETIAALIVEPLVQGAAGMRMYHPDYLRGARELCTRYRVHLIADEIMTGMGRTGTMFACEQAAIAPDFLCLSKGLTGGYLPLSVVLTTDDVYGAFYDDDNARAFLHSHSYTGNPLACSAALATLDLFADDDVIVANRSLAARLTERALELADLPQVRNFRHLGMIWGFEVDTVDPEFSRRLFNAALARGVLLRPIGNTVYFMPPYVIDEAAIEHLVVGTRDALRACLAA
ncbi:MAG: adenosylmethionine--8-amino-7-oxononanoate transaminase [Proteobacteria bacterium]|nr:adenosylmethionine--8-amino-7-oxononanoate transaminase [Burkholderiales bacterium]